jgi:CheY-like chemotaxis protein
MSGLRPLLVASARLLRGRGRVEREGDEGISPGASRAERVLVVEDRTIVRELAHDILADAGFEVVSAGSGAEALALTANAERFDLLLTDVVMPQMSGPELAVILRGRQAGLPVLFMSGYIGDVLDASALVEPATAFLCKPFASAELVAKTRALLDAVPRTAAPLTP